MENKKKILIVEDEKAMRMALVDKFEKFGYAIFEAGDGEEGYRVALKERPDLILLDVIMPKINGMALLKMIRDDVKWGNAVPIIMLTNLSDPESVSEAAKYEVYDFLVKTDWRLDDVVKLVQEKLQLKPQ